MGLIQRLRQMERYLSTAEVMTLIGVTRTTLCHWVRTGRLTAIRVGNGYLFDPRMLADWLSKRETSTTSARNAA